MRLWTIQPCHAWELLQRQGKLQTEPALIEPDFLPAYRWMREQMIVRSGAIHSNPPFPIWAWYQYGPQKKPDLRRSGHLPRGSCGVRLECEIEESRVLLSDFDLWHFVLNYWYLSDDENDDAAFDSLLEARGLNYYRQEPLSDPVLHARIAASWQRIFDLDWINEYTGSTRREEKYIQATFWELRLSDVKRIQKFIAR